MPDKDVEKNPSIEDLISLSEAADRFSLSHSHLRLLVRKKEIWGIKMGRNWLTTAEAVEKYLKKDRKPGPKPKDK